MPNDTVSVAGEAMPATLSRRFFLSRMGGVAAATALAAAPAATEILITENPDLLALGRDFEAKHAELLQAAELVDSLQPMFLAQAPALPEEISGEEHSRFGGWRYADIYRDPASPRLDDLKNANGRRMLVIHSYRLERIFEGDDMPPSIRHLHQVALDFEAGTNAALLASGLADALETYSAAESSLRRIVYTMSQIRARTPVGLAVKVRTTGAYAGMGSEERLSASLWLANSMWCDLEDGEAFA
jgi:hypothetical protein